MAKKWNDVASSPEYQSLAPEKQENARQQYFRTVVAPQVPPEKLDTVRQQFDTSTKKAPSEEKPGASNISKGAAMLLAPAAYVAKSLYDPMGTIKGLAQGAANVPGDIAKRVGQDFSGMTKGAEQAMTSPTIMGRLGGAAKVGLGAVQTAFDPMNSLVENTYGKQASQATGGLVSPQNASALPEAMLPAGVGLLRKGAQVAEPAIKGALKGIGADLSQVANNPDAIQSALKTGIQNTTKDIASAGGVSPVTSPSQLSVRIAGGLGKAYQSARDLVKQQYDIARGIGKALPAQVSNIEQLNQITGKEAGQLEVSQGVEKLRDQVMSDQEEILAIRQKLHDLTYEGEQVSPKTATQAELSQRRIKAAQDQLAQKQSNAEVRKQQLAVKEKQLKEAPKGGMPLRIETGEDLINLRQALRKKNVANMSDAEQTAHVASIAEVDKAINEMSVKNPAFKQRLATADAGYTKLKSTYESDAAKSLGIDKEFLKNAKGKTKENLINSMATTTGLPDKIYAPFQVKWLKDNMSPMQFKKLMATKIQTVLNDATKSTEAFQQNRELLEYMLSNGLSLKSKLYKPQLDALDKVVEELSKGKISLNMSPSEYRDAMGAAAQAINAIKASASVVSAGKLNAFGIAKAAEALSPAEKAEAKKLLVLRKKALPPTQSLTGPAVGAALGGMNVNGQQQ